MKTSEMLAAVGRVGKALRRRLRRRGSIGMTHYQYRHPASRLDRLEPRTLLSGFDDAAVSLPPNIASYLAEYYHQAVAASLSAAAPGPASAAPLEASVGEKTNPELADLSGLLVLGDEGRALVDIWKTGADVEILDELEALGATIVTTSDEYRLVEAWLDPLQLPAVATLDGVLSVTPVYRPIQRAGSVQTQGDAVIHADDVRAAGYDGSSILVGVLSDSALDINNSQATGDLPPIVDRYLEFPDSDEGRAMLEIVHDIAPGAQLAHHSGNYGEPSFAEGIRELAAAGAKVICDDIGYPTEPFFQDGIIAQAINEVAAAGVTYVSAAGNDAGHAYESSFVDAGGAGPGTGYHDFDPGPAVDVFQRITLPSVPAGYFRNVTLSLQWDQPFYSTGVTSDYDIYLYGDDGTTVLQSTADRNLSLQKPVDVLVWKQESFSDTTPHVAIRLVQGSAQARLKYLLLVTDATIDEYATNSSSVWGHPAAAGAIAVGAVPYYAPDTIEPFSSRGDVTIYFDAAGNRLASPQVRQKPDVVAPDNVNTTFFGTDIPQDADTRPNFSGTSAAAPHVAGVAALLLDANPHLTRSELYSVLTSTAVDLPLDGSAPGRDEVYGYGRVDASAAVTAAVTPAVTPDVTPPTATMTSPIPVHGWNVDHIDVRFSEPLTPAIATNAANFALIGAGEDGTFGTSDDVSYTVAVAYNDAARTSTVTFSAPAADLVDGQYRLTLRASGLHDPAGNPLSGGADQVFPLTITGKSAILAADLTANFDLRSDGSATMVYSINPIRDREYWPQVLVGQFDEGGQSQGPFRCFLPNDFETYAHGIRHPDTALWNSGGVVVFDDWQGAIPGDYDYYEIHFQLLDAAGQTYGPDRWVTTAYGNTDWVVPRVDANASGDFAFVWLSMLEPLTGADVAYVWAAIFDSQGVKKAGPFPVSLGGRFNPVVAMATDGSVVFAFLGGDTDGSGVFVRRFSATGNPLGEAVRASTIGGTVSNPEIEMAADGSFVVAWNGTTGPNGSFGGVFFRRFDSGGNPLGTELRQTSQSSDAQPQIAVTSDGRFVICWRQGDGDGGGIFAQRFAANGSRVGGVLWISEGSIGDQSTPRVDMRANGDFIVTWSESGGARCRWISWNAPNEVLPFGPFVESLSASNPIDGRISSLTVTFDRPINPSTFTGAGIADPVGRPVAVTAVETTDNVTFTVRFVPQQLAGQYQITIGPSVADSQGRLLNSDGDLTNGEPGDSFQGRFMLESTTASLPIAEGFENGSLDALPSYLSFYRSLGAIDVSRSNSPYDGAFDLKMESQNRSLTSAVIFKLDLSDESAASDIVLDFWANYLRPSSNPGNLAAYLFVSGNGVNWRQIDGGLAVFGGSLQLDANTYKHFAFDLDQQLKLFGIALDEDVYVKFEALLVTAGDSDLALDNIRIRRDAINNAPTLSTINTLTNATEDESYTIDYATLAAAADEADANGDTLSFRIDSVTTGSLTKGGVPVTPYPLGTTLLGPGESVVWMPANASGTVNAFTVRAWDGDLASGEPVQVKVIVAAVNDAPVLDTSCNPALTPVAEDSTNPSGNTVSNFAAACITDIDSGALKGIAVVGLTGTGTWQYKTGSTWTAFGPVSESAALPLTDTNYLRFVPNTNFNGTATVSYHAWDRTTGTAGTPVELTPPGATGGTTAYSTAVATATITVTPVNDAPVLDNSGTMMLDATPEDDLVGAGTLVSQIIASAGGDRITDVDAGAVEGIAVTAVFEVAHSATSWRAVRRLRC